MKLTKYLIYFIIKYLIYFIIILTISGIGYFSFKNYENIKTKYSIAINNNKAYQSEIYNLQGKANIYLLTIDQIKYSKDSIDKKFTQTIKDLKIKDKRIEQLQYIVDSIKIKDTIMLKDTIFIKDLNIDTVIKKEFYTIGLQLKYPNTIIMSPELQNEKIVIFSTVKETINPPNKWWIFRIFQKKHTIVTVDIKDSNPYVRTTKSRFIEILKN